MSDETPRRRSPFWIMACMVLIAWVAGGVYRHQVPPLTTARAMLQVPSATDLGTLCQRADIFQAAVEQLEADGDLFITFEQQAGKPRLSGTLTATKVKVAPPANGLNPATSTSQISTETWELTYRTPRSERALGELAALITVLQSRVAPATVEKSPVAMRAENHLARLEMQHQELQQQLEDLATEADAGLANPTQLATLRDRVQALQKALTESQVQRLQCEEEWRLVEHEVGQNPRLEATVAKLSAGPVQEAVLQIEKQRKLSTELRRLNETERRLGNVYGEKHPKLIELRLKFEQILSELGGWDHVLDDGHVAERLQASLEQLLELKQQHETDLEMQLELEKQELSTLSQSSERRAVLTAQFEQLTLELAQARQSTSAGAAAGLAEFTILQVPEIAAPHWTGHFAVLAAIATFGGLIAGGMLHRMWATPVYPDADEPFDPPATSNYVPIQETPLDLAQRRALRQARLQQAYAA